MTLEKELRGVRRAMESHSIALKAIDKIKEPSENLLLQKQKLENRYHDLSTQHQSLLREQIYG